MTERCYNCGKEEKITKGVSNIEKIEVDLAEYSKEGEKYMPLCSECSEKLENGEIEGIEEKWKAEKNKARYSSLEEPSEDEEEYLECYKCGKLIPIGVLYYSVNKEIEKSKGEIEAENLFIYCEDCFKKLEVVMKKK